MEQNQRTNLAIRVLLLLLASHGLFVFVSNTIEETHPGVVVNIKETVPSSVVELLAYNNRALRANKLYARGLNCSETDNDHGEKADGLGSFHGETEIADSPMKSSKFLDFYIMGFPKCATSSLMHLFKEIVNETDIIWMDGGIKEYNMNAKENVKRLLEKIEEGRNDTNSEVKKYGVKWPGGLSQGSNFLKSMSNLMELNPQHEETKIIIGMRHPVRQFESFWNYREVVYHDMPSPSTLIGSSKVGSRGVYTEIGQFEKHLMQLGKFSLRKDDYAWLDEHQKVVLPTKNKVYLYLQEQFQDENVTRFQKFLDDLLSFVGVGEAKVTPDDFPHSNVGHKVKPFNICDEEHKAVRDVLLAGGKATANWFQRNLESSRDIYVSDKEFFLSLVNTWGQDPCVSGKE